MNGRRLTTWLLLMLVAGASAAKETAPPPENFAVSKSSTALEWLPANPELGYSLRVQLPDGDMVTDQFAPGEVPFWSFTPGSKGAIDGLYIYELVSNPAGLSARDEMSNELKTGKQQVIRQSGFFTVQNGQVIQGKTEESMAKDIVHADDVIINGGGSALCVGFDCIDGEGFGSDTLRLKENNLRIHFDDTSIGSFPANDWRIIANETGDGGANFLGFEDSTAGRRVMTIGANAPSDSLVIENSSGDVGIGTAAPALELHVRDGDTPSLRLEQDNSAGFGAQTWDLSGNETSFFVRDATNGSTLPFRIFPGASSNSLVIAGDSDIGVGTLSPQAKLDVQTSGGAFRVAPFGSSSVKLSSSNSYGMDALQYRFQVGGVDAFFIDSASGGRNIGIGTISPSSKFEVKTSAGTFNVGAFGSGSVKLSSSNSYGMDATQYRFQISGNDAFFIDNSRDIGIGTLSPTAKLDVNGEVKAANFNSSSSIDVKNNIRAVDAKTILAKVALLPVKEWSYNQSPAKRHIGPMAEDFYAHFGLGMDSKHIAVTDLAGVALAATKALKKENDRLQSEAEQKDARIQALEDRLNHLESIVLGSR